MNERKAFKALSKRNHHRIGLQKNLGFNVLSESDYYWNTCPVPPQIVTTSVAPDPFTGQLHIPFPITIFLGVTIHPGRKTLRIGVELDEKIAAAAKQRADPRSRFSCWITLRVRPAKRSSVSKPRAVAVAVGFSRRTLEIRSRFRRQQFFFLHMRMCMCNHPVLKCTYLHAGAYVCAGGWVRVWGCVGEIGCYLFARVPVQVLE